MTSDDAHCAKPRTMAPPCSPACTRYPDAGDSRTFTAAFPLASSTGRAAFAASPLRDRVGADAPRARETRAPPATAPVMCVRDDQHRAPDDTHAVSCGPTGCGAG